MSKNMLYTFVIMFLCCLTADANAVRKEGGKTATALSLLRNVQACEGKTPTSVEAIKKSCTDLSNECNILENDPKLESDEQRAMLFQQCVELIQPCALTADSCLDNNKACLKSSDGDNCKASFFKDTADTFAEFLKNLP